MKAALNVRVKSTGQVGHVFHIDKLEPNRSYIVRVKGTGYYSLGEIKSNQLEVL